MKGGVLALPYLPVLSLTSSRRRVTSSVEPLLGVGTTFTRVALLGLYSCEDTGRPGCLLQSLPSPAHTDSSCTRPAQGLPASSPRHPSQMPPRVG